jgi:N utilization substance protein A
MSIVKLPGLKMLIEEISKSNNLPENLVKEALREALFKGYERFRRAKQATTNQTFPDDYFDNFRLELDVEEEGFRVLALKMVTDSVD